ncbi:MAG: M23 family metallopeptidase [Oscillospiraceae bacterium]|nr:M23 family metallopeptidase [Oscillospiraceae bacterium]
MKRNSKSVLSGKGFYIALTLSVAMVGAACYFAYTQTSEDYTGQVESGFGVAESSQQQDVAKIQTDVTKSTIKTSTSTAFTTMSKLTEETVAKSETEVIALEHDMAEETVKEQSFTLSMPLEGEVLNEYSNGELVKSNTTGAWQTHNGVDIKAEVGDTVTASADGTVSAVENDPLWGVAVTVDHGNGVTTRYCNLNSDVAVQAGQEISSGEQIGAVGQTADIESEEEVHLHFEVVKNGSYANPSDFM